VDADAVDGAADLDAAHREVAALDAVEGVGRVVRDQLGVLHEEVRRGRRGGVVRELP
jgi:hypothetical protein